MIFLVEHLKQIFPSFFHHIQVSRFVEQNFAEVNKTHIAINGLILLWNWWIKMVFCSLFCFFKYLVP